MLLGHVVLPAAAARAPRGEAGALGLAKDIIMDKNLGTGLLCLAV